MRLYISMFFVFVMWANPSISRAADTSRDEIDVCYSMISEQLSNELTVADYHIDEISDEGDPLSRSIEAVKLFMLERDCNPTDVVMASVSEMGVSPAKRHSR